MLVLALLTAVEVSAQVTAEQLEPLVVELRSKLQNASLDGQSREQILRQIASRLNHIGDIRYANGEHELATKAFVEADAALRQSHESAYARSRSDLDHAEKQLVEFSNDPNPETRPIRINIGRMLVSIQLTQAISEANYFDDVEAQRKYLARLGEVARDSGDIAKEAECNEKLGRIEFENDNSSRAFELYDKALELRKKAAKNEWWTLDLIAGAKWYLGDFDTALDNYRQVVDATKKIDEGPVVFPSGASDTLKEAITYERAVLRTVLTQALLNIAQINATRGNYGAANEAVSETQTVIKIMKTAESATEGTARSILLVSRVSAEANLLRMRGRLLEAQGDESGAAGSLKESADLFSQISGGAPSGAVAGLRSRLATIYSRQGKFDEARANIREALRIRTRLLQESGVAYTLMQASRIELAAKQPEAALQLARQAKISAAKTGLDDIIAEGNEVEADVLLQNSSDVNSPALASAIDGFRSAAEIFKRADMRPALARASDSLGIAYERAGRVIEAEKAYKDAISAVEFMRTSFTTAEESDSFSDRGDITGIYQRLVDLLVKQGRIEEALQYATRAQRRDLIDATPVDDIKLAGGGAETLAKVLAANQREQTARGNLTNTRTELASVLSPDKKSLTAAIGEARIDYAEAAKRLEIEVPDLRLTVRPTDLKALQATVGPREAIISYLVTPDTLFIFVVRHDGISARPVPVSRNVLRTLIARTREGLREFSDDFYQLSSDADTGFAMEKARPDLRIDERSEHYKKHLAPLNNSLRSLYQKMITPVEDLISGADTLKVIPNAELFLLPIAALISPKDNKYLLERYALVFATAGDLSNSRKAGPGSLLIAFGNPTEANLDGALEEVKAIRKVFPSSKLYTEDKATKEQLFKLTSAKILHFATHGHIKSPPQSSTIQLARLPNIKEPDLSYGEIWKLPLRSTDMVVLSACETALGGVSGTEAGVFIEAFRKMTNSVAASLWSVDDFATRELMVEFYRNLAAGQTRSAAMRSAQLKLLRDGRTKNPLFWAAFVLYGDGGRLSGMAAARPKRSR